MTSVRNHRQRLSGSRLLLTAALALMIQSCWIFKPREKPPVVDVPSDTTIVVVPPDTPGSPVDTIPGPTKLIFKELYKVAIILPFAIDDHYITDFDYKDRTTPYRSMMALELYQGIRMALDDLNGTGINIQVHVYDTKNSASEVNRILAQPELARMDVIIGPIFEHGVRTVAEFGLKHGIHIICPLGQPEAVPNNSYLICANASIESHLTSLANFLDAKYGKTKLVIVRRDDSEEGRLASVLTRRLSELNSTIRPTETIRSGWELFPKGTFGNDTVLVFCPSEDEAFVNEVTRQLALAVEHHPIILIGMPSWLTKFESLSFDFLDQLSLHVTSNLWVNDEDTAVEQLSARYRERYGIAPSDFVYRGYDIMNWVVILMKNFGISFAEHFNEAPQDNLFSRFYILPVNHRLGSGSLGSVSYFENQHVHVLRYRNFELMKVN